MLLITTSSHTVSLRYSLDWWCVMGITSYGWSM